MKRKVPIKVPKRYSMEKPERVTFIHEKVSKNIQITWAYILSLDQRNTRIYSNSYVSPWVLCDKLSVFLSLWASIMGTFGEVNNLNIHKICRLYCGHCIILFSTGFPFRTYSLPLVFFFFSTTTVLHRMSPFYGCIWHSSQGLSKTRKQM